MIPGQDRDTQHMTTERSLRPHPFSLLAGIGMCALAATQAHTQEARCAGEVITQGRVSSIIDGRSLTLQDGRTVRLAGVEDTVSGISVKTAQQSALEALVGDRDVMLRGNPKTDRYGRLVGFVFISGQDQPVQATLVEAGHLAVTAPVDDSACAVVLRAREFQARQAKRGIWAEPAALKNAEMPGDILTLVGRFVVVEGRVVSVREAGATLYINFGRRWTQDLAVTISRRNVAAFEAAGVPVKSLERKRILVRGWVEQRGVPRLHASWPGQIETADTN
jgi:endonuclease YncB( thermonuclease family)